jgi:hypothetical protein
MGKKPKTCVSKCQRQHGFFVSLRQGGRQMKNLLEALPLQNRNEHQLVKLAGWR